MEPKARQVHIVGAGSRIKSTENKLKPLCMSGLDPCSAAGLEELGQALVFEASYHSLNVTCNVLGVNLRNANIKRGPTRASGGRPQGRKAGNELMTGL